MNECGLSAEGRGVGIEGIDGAAQIEFDQAQTDKAGVPGVETSASDCGEAA